MATVHNSDRAVRIPSPAHPGASLHTVSPEQREHAAASLDVDDAGGRGPHHATPGRLGLHPDGGEGRVVDEHLRLDRSAAVASRCLSRGTSTTVWTTKPPPRVSAAARRTRSGHASRSPNAASDRVANPGSSEAGPTNTAFPP